MKGLLRGQQGTGSMTLHLPSENGCRANISISRKLIRDHPLILSVHFPREKLSISATCADFLEPGGQGDGKAAKKPSHEIWASVCLEVAPNLRHLKYLEFI